MEGGNAYKLRVALLHSYGPHFSASKSRVSVLWNLRDRFLSDSRRLIDMQPKRRIGSSGGNSKISYKACWSKEEDANLINGWLQNSADRRDGGTNWENIAAYVNEKSPNQSCSRNVSSCKGRWMYMSSCVGKFINAMTEARKIATDGMSETDIWDLANKLYWEDTKGTFCFAHAYELLHAAPRYLEVYCNRQKRKGIFPLNALGQSNVGSSKRLRMDEEDNYSASSDSGAPKLGDYSSPPHLAARPIGEGIPDERFMLDMGNLKDPDWNNSQLFGDEWKEVKLQEIQAKKEIEEKRLEFEREKEANQMQQKDLDRKYKILEKLLDKESLSPAEEALRNKLFEELC